MSHAAAAAIDTSSILSAFALTAHGAEALQPCTDLAFHVPTADLVEFQSLPEARRNEVLLTLRLIERIAGQRDLVRTARAIAAQYAHIRGLSATSLLRKYYALRASVSTAWPHGNWRVLVKNYKMPSQQPPEFISHLKRRFAENQRSIDAAIRAIRSEWESGEPVPGYGTWMEWFVAVFPKETMPKRFPFIYPLGWSKANLRRYAPSRGELALVRRGFSAAKRFFPHVRRDPSGLRPLEWIVMDDFWTKVNTVWPGGEGFGPQIAYTGGLLAMDVGTRKRLALGLKPRLERPDGTCIGIGDADVRTLLYALFSEHGVPDYPITILHENATARISPDFKLALTTLFDGRIRFESTSLIEHKTFTNGFVERGGTPWEKGWIESQFNLAWNEGGAMRGWKGSNERLNAPANLPAVRAYVQQLIAQGDGKHNLPPEIIERLRLPFQFVSEAVAAFTDLFDRLDRRTDHRCVGFEQVTEWRLEEHEAPRPFEELALVPVEQQQRVQILQRMESPLERWQRLSAAHPRRAVPESILALLLLTPKRDCTYRNHAVSFVHEKKGYSYIDETGEILRTVPEGTQFLGYFDPTTPLHLHICTQSGAFVGTLRRAGGRSGAIDIRDTAAIKEEAAVMATIRNRVLSEVRERHAETDTQLLADRQHNARVVAEFQSTAQASQIATSIATAKALQNREVRLARATEDLAAQAAEALEANYRAPDPSAP